VETADQKGDAATKTQEHVSKWWIRRWYVPITVVLLLGLLALCVPGCRQTVLIALGQLLVIEPTPVKSADVIVMAIDVGSAGALKAADLVHEGVAQRVAIFDDPPSAVDREFLSRGLPYTDWAVISTHQLHSLGVQNVEQIPKKTSGSEQEGVILPGWCKRNGYHTVVLVTSLAHTRRLGRIMRRDVQDPTLRIVIVGSPYSDSGFAPGKWWKSRGGIRTEIVEGEKLLLDFIRHPFS
jgi:hypothetical protein